MRIPNLYHFNDPLFIDCNHDYISEVTKHLKKYDLVFEKLMNFYEAKGLFSKPERDFYRNKMGEDVAQIIKILGYFTNEQNRFKAYEEFNNFMNSSGPMLASLSDLVPVGSNFYRLRPDHGAIQERKKKSTQAKYLLFHIPFNLRRKVNNLRFNSQGIPCLYSANNLRTAWIESKKPGSINLSIRNELHFNAGLFLNKTPIVIGDFTLKDMKGLHDDAMTHYKRNPKRFTDYLSYIRLYPMICCLHTKIIYSSNEWVTFNNEYVFPSLLMDWLLSEQGQKYFVNPAGVRGIKYSSVEAGNPYVDHNYVMPTKYEPGLKYCTLLTNCLLSGKSYYYIFQDQIDRRKIKKINGRTIKAIEKVLVANCRI